MALAMLPTCVPLSSRRACACRPITCSSQTSLSSSRLSASSLEHGSPTRRAVAARSSLSQVP